MTRRSKHGAPGGVARKSVRQAVPRSRPVTVKAGRNKRAKAETCEATLFVHPRGFAFATPVGEAAGRFGKDIFIPPDALAGAMHGDTVLVELVAHRRDRAEGRVMEVVKRGITRLVGFYVAGRATGLVTPEDPRLPFSVVIKRQQSLGATNGAAVVVEIVKFREQGNPEGKIIEVLGDPARPEVQTEMALRAFALPFVFSDETLAETEALSAKVRVDKGRTDLRKIPHVTIDSETARDFDDAVALESSGKGFRLYVSIADVSHYVRPGTALDQEAYARGTSVYFPSKVVPMLPERISNGLCSLVPGEDRYAFTAIIEFDGKGRRRKARFVKSVINSYHRLTYTKVAAMLSDHDPALRKQYADVLPALEEMGRLAALINRQRMERGSIGFEIPEAAIALDEEGAIASISRSERNMAHKLIEEFMLSANEAVADHLAAAKIDTLYRIHEEPDPTKVTEFAEFGRCMGLELPTGSGPAWFGQVLALVAGTPREYIVSNLLLQAMQQARYAPRNVGHFGLASPCYTHFTSPIRRYPDLMVHRALAAQTGEGEGRDTAEAGEFLSRRERLAVEAERNVVERLVALYMADKVGDEFAAVISGVAAFGLFVELTELMVSGAVALADMTDDYYEVDEKSHRLIGRRNNRTYQIGKLIRVRLVKVDRERRRLSFVLAAEQPAEAVNPEESGGKKAAPVTPRRQRTKAKASSPVVDDATGKKAPAAEKSPRPQRKKNIFGFG